MDNTGSCVEFPRIFIFGAYVRLYALIVNAASVGTSIHNIKFNSGNLVPVIKTKPK